MRLLKSLIAGVGLLCMSTQAHAAIASVVAEDNPGLFSVSFPSANEFVFSWTQSPGAAFIEFTTSNQFRLSLDSYTSTSSGNSRLQLRNSAGTVLLPTVTPAGLSVVTPGQLNPLAAADGDVPGGNGDGLQFGPGDSGVLFSALAAGTYYLGVQENGNPSNGVVSFSVAPVPIPAAGVLFGSALMGAAALRRRKTAHAA